MTVRYWIGTLALGLAVGLPSAVFAQDATKAPKTQKGDSKTKSPTQKTSDKSSKGGQKGGGKAGTGAESADEVTDSWITMKIKTDLVNESALKSSDITVETKNKIVTLKGTVASDAGKARAEQIAKATQGVTKVVDNLTVKAK
jgi:osmotically-inducible protein OsmY